MKEITTYIADDGSRFDCKRECADYENLCSRVDNIMSALRPRDDSGRTAVRQDTMIVKQTYTELMKLCSEVMPRHERIFNECAAGTRHRSHAGRIISDYWNEYRCLAAADYRFDCIDWETGIEYEQPYYTSNPHYFKGEIV